MMPEQGALPREMRPRSTYNEISQLVAVDFWSPSGGLGMSHRTAQFHLKHSCPQIEQFCFAGGQAYWLAAVPFDLPPSSIEGRVIQCHDGMLRVAPDRDSPDHHTKLAAIIDPWPEVARPGRMGHQKCRFPFRPP